VSLDLTDHVVKMAQMVPREEKDQEVKLVQLEIPVKRANSVFLDCLDTLDVQARKEQEDLKDQQEDLV